MSIYLGNTPLAHNAVSRNIGEIIQSTIPLSDAGLHLLDGALINGTGSYSAFVTYIAGLVSNYPDLFTTETAWQQAVTDYGVCGKFVYDSTNNTVRLPKITGFTEGTTDVTALGILTQAGVPNITGEFRVYSNNSDPSIEGCSGAFGQNRKTTGTNKYNDATVKTSSFAPSYIDFDASRSSSIYGNSSTVQPQSVKVLYYIVVANSVKTNIEVDIDEIMTDLNAKVDKADLSPVQCVVEYYVNGSSWYRIWSADSNGKICIEQGGVIPASTTSITLLKNYKNIDYSVVMSGSNYGKADQPLGTKSKTVSGFTVETSTGTRSWVAIGEGA